MGMGGANIANNSENTFAKLLMVGINVITNGGKYTL